MVFGDIISQETRVLVLINRFGVFFFFNVCDSLTFNSVCVYVLIQTNYHEKQSRFDFHYI